MWHGNGDTWVQKLMFGITNWKKLGTEKTNMEIKCQNGKKGIRKWEN